ncbi:protein D2-like [Anthonomus grandis grandis]|uniref:protein D2-like n=1 Tax=Anthonomus grandis grandis TaxID=2921223 RepID=UPI00216615C3|nr:protein D2-like [Anthonomus grandis grandis]
MEVDGVVPDTLDSVPSAKITVTYPNNLQVEFGGELTPSQVIEQPQVTWEADSDKYYTLSMVDPDAPSRDNPIYREINHWLVVNIKGNDLSTGETITAYVGSRPPKHSGLHRYIFIVFEHNEKIHVTDENLDTERRNFLIKRFAKKYNLGKAYAGNFYKAQWDSSVPDMKR